MSTYQLCAYITLHSPEPESIIIAEDIEVFADVSQLGLDAEIKGPYLESEGTVGHWTVPESHWLYAPARAALEKQFQEQYSEIQSELRAAGLEEAADMRREDY